MKTMNFSKLLCFLVLTSIFVSCNEKKKNIKKSDAMDEQTMGKMQKKGQFNYGDEVTFMKSYIDVIELVSPSGNEKIAVSADLQGRVMTSTAFGNEGSGYGWINKELFESKEPQEHIHVYGGEERFWLGPEGGQFSIFFKKGDDFTLDNWYTPKQLDTEPFNVKSTEKSKVTFVKETSLTNYSGFKFDIGIEREVALLSSQEIAKTLSVNDISELGAVGYRTTNTLTNLGKADWKKETGLLSIWLLGMFPPSPSNVIIIPYHPGSEKELGPMVNDAYFGKVPSDRLVEKDSVLYYSGDGKYRGKIGLSPSRAKNILGAYDSKNGILTIVKFDKPEGVTDYINSMWEIQKEPYSGDVVNSYNDGPPEPGKKPLGPFYELETSSPALALKAGESGVHQQYVFHFEGDEAQLQPIIKALLGSDVETIKNVFGPTSNK